MKIICEQCREEFDFNSDDILLSTEQIDRNRNTLLRLICRKCREIKK